MIYGLTRGGWGGFVSVFIASVCIIQLQASDTSEVPVIPNNPAGGRFSLSSPAADYTPLEIGKLRGVPETLGPSSRKTGLVISEIMYNPPPRSDGRNLEFIELFNSDATPENISGYRLSGEIEFTFPTNTTIPARGFLVVAPVPADIQSVYGISGVAGGFTNDLSNGGGLIRLRNHAGSVLLQVNYSNEHPWPVAPDNAGHSLLLARPSYGEANPLAWSASDLMGGTPGMAEAVSTNPYRTLLINEFLAHTDAPELDFIELFNYSAQPVTLDGCILTDDPATNKFVLPAGTTIPARGFLVYNQDQLHFALEAAGETIYLIDPARTRVIDAVRFKAQGNSISTGRFPDGAPRFSRLQSKTPGSSNSPMLIHDIVINEIMYHPISGERDDEYVELYNRGFTAVNLGGWRLADGIEFSFPANFMIPANGYVVVANNVSRLLTNYPNLHLSNTAGNFQGSLANNGERLVLTMPDTIISTNNNVTVTNTIHIPVDEVTYREGGRWGKWADGGGSSLELIDPNSDHRFASNWADSDETAKAGWTTVQFTGVLDHGQGAIDELQVFLQGAGECLVDDVEVLNSSGVNLVSNPSFENGLTGWVPQGNHSESGLEQIGFNSSRSLHIRALGRGDNGANRVRTPLTSALSAGSTATIRARVRWLRGFPEVLLRLHGNHIEAIGVLSLPVNLGTPGARNSQTAVNANVGPAIFNVTHSPILPAANQAVTIIAEAHDPQGISSLVVKYRVDPSPTLATINMVNNGAGFYSATIPGRATGTLVAFHVEARDNSNPSTVTRFPNEAPIRECLIRFGETQPAGTFGAYRIWVTQATLNRWSTRLKLDNGALDATFVYGNQRAVYNTGTLYSGSPWISPGYNTPIGNLCGYVLNFPSDDMLLGARDFVLDWPIRDSTLQLEQVAYWIAKELDAPYNHRRFVHLFVNGVKRGTIFEDTQQPNSDVIEELFPDDTDGDLHKIEDWFEFDDSAVKEFNVDATLQRFTTTGGAKKLARYRWTWRKRATDTPNSYANLFALVDAVNTTGNAYTAAVESLVDVEEWMRIFAVEHIAGNWDSYGYNRGKNMFTYKPENGKWIMMMWDIDFVLGAGGDGATTSMFNANDSTITRMYNHPPFRRAYYRAWQDAVNGPLVSSNIGPVMDAKYSALLANGVATSSPTAGKAFIASRRNYLLQQLALVAANFSVTSNNGNNFSTNRNNLILAGTAPIEVKTIKINGTAYPLTWTTVTNWSLSYSLQAGLNQLAIQGYDLRGNALGNSTRAINVTYTGATEPAQGNLIINEIMYNPTVPDAAFVEIHNRSVSTTFDLSNHRLDGADFTFPEGTIIQPGGFLVVANNISGFAAAYGAAIPIAGVMEGRLDNGGETLKLIQPASGLQPETVIDEMSYDDDPPWPASADGFGASLQLIDPAQDNNRVANWAAVTTASGGSQQSLIAITQAWKYNESGVDLGSAWRMRAFDDSTWMSGPGLLYVENAALPAPKNTALTLGRTTYYFRTHFNFTGDPAGAALNLSPVLDDGAVFYLNGIEVLRLGMPAGAISYGTFASRTVTEASFEGEFTIPMSSLRQGDNVLAVEVHQVNATSSDIVFGLTLEARSSAGNPFTPGAVNSVRANLSPFPLLWLNEVQPNNASGVQDRFGERDPWVELYNSGSAAINLNGYYLSDAYTNMLRWAFPANTTLNPSEFLIIWLDGEPGESTTGELHANFRIPSTGGSVVLAQTNGGQTSIVDYLNYDLVEADRSYGAFPDGTPAKRNNFYFATPRSANTDAFPTNAVFINEWLAGNANTLADPADGNYDDWFELFNAGPNNVDLSGYSLTDDLTNPAKWLLPSGTIIGAKQFLLVWADEDTAQNGLGSPDLHANFRLSLAGETIGLYAPNGAIVDQVTFGTQTNNVSQGRWPDGSAGQYVFMTNPTPRSANRGGDSPAIRILGVTQSSPDTITLSWAAANQTKYQIQYKDNLNDIPWRNLGEVITAAGPTASASDSLSSSSQRYYRVVLVQ
jgi:hypothetical protein